jgi:hypothetical protein
MKTTREHTDGPSEECPACQEEFLEWWMDESKLYRNTETGHLTRVFDAKQETEK